MEWTLLSPTRPQFLDQEDAKSHFLPCLCIEDQLWWISLLWWRLESWMVCCHQVSWLVSWCKGIWIAYLYTITLLSVTSFNFFFLLLAVLGVRPSKCRISDCNNTNNNRRQKKAKAKSTVPSGMQVIDLVDDIPARSTTLHSMISSAIPSTAALQDSSSESTVSPSLCLPQQVPSTTAIAFIAITQASSLPIHQSEPSSTSTHMPILSNARNTPTLPPNSSNLSSSSSPSVPSDKTPPSQVVADENSTTTGSTISSLPATDTALGEQWVQLRWVSYLSQITCQSFTDWWFILYIDKPIVSTSYCMISCWWWCLILNDRANLSIPNPPVQVPIEMSAAPASKAKAGKPIVASLTLLTA